MIDKVYQLIAWHGSEMLFSNVVYTSHNAATAAIDDFKKDDRTLDFFGSKGPLLNVYVGVIILDVAQ